MASHPAAVAKLRKRDSTVVEVIGFLHRQILEYFDYYPFSDLAKPAELKKYFSLHPNVLHMCYLPNHAAIVAYLFEVTGRVPKTETEIYDHFTRFTLMRSITKDENIEPDDVDVHNLNEEDNKLFT